MSSGVVIDGVEVRLEVAHDPDTGMYTNNGTHGVVIIHSGGSVDRIAPGESLTPAKDGKAAVILRTRPPVA